MIKVGKMDLLMIFEETVLVSWNGVVLGVKEMKAGGKCLQAHQSKTK